MAWVLQISVLMARLYSFIGLVLLFTTSLAIQAQTDQKLTIFERLNEKELRTIEKVITEANTRYEQFYTNKTLKSFTLWDHESSLKIGEIVTKYPLSEQKEFLNSLNGVIQLSLTATKHKINMNEVPTVVVAPVKKISIERIQEEIALDIESRNKHQTEFLKETKDKLNNQWREVRQTDKQALGSAKINFVREEQDRNPSENKGRTLDLSK